jgi:hypothetical protein
MRLPHPEVLADLCRTYPRIERGDIIASWNNASRHWFDLETKYRIDEPCELDAARALFVRYQFEKDETERSSYIHCMWRLVEPYCKKR